jgi:hypothetical protein
MLHYQQLRRAQLCVLSNSKNVIYDIADFVTLDDDVEYVKLKIDSVTLY